MLTNSKKIVYSTMLTVIIAAFLFANPRFALLEEQAAQGAYYRGEYLLTTYYPAPYGNYAQLQAGSGDVANSTGILKINDYMSIYGKKLDPSPSMSGFSSDFWWVPFMAGVKYTAGTYYHSNFSIADSNNGDSGQDYGILNLMYSPQNRNRTMVGMMNVMETYRPTTAWGALGIGQAIGAHDGSGATGEQSVVQAFQPVGTSGCVLMGNNIAASPLTNLDKVYGVRVRIVDLTGTLTSIDNPGKDHHVIDAYYGIPGPDDQDKKYTIYSTGQKNYFEKDVYIGAKASAVAAIGSFVKSPSTLGTDLYVQGNAGISSAIYIGDFMYLKPRASAPANPQKGMVYFHDDGTTVAIKYYDGSAWKTLTGS